MKSIGTDENVHEEIMRLKLDLKLKNANEVLKTLLQRWKNDGGTL